MDEARPGEDPAPSPSAPSTQERWAAWAFVAVLVVALPVLFHYGREQWFFLDEWDFLAGRDIRSPNDLLRPHNEHWSTVPIIMYRLVFRAVGLNHYWPYLALAIGGHLAAASLLRATMRRAGADPWIATATATLLVSLGSGRHNILWGFQVAWTLSLAFGLAHLLLADHDGPRDRRDLAGLACGLVAIMSSGIGVPMVVGVGASVLFRRGWVAAAGHTVPLGAIYLLWYFWQRPPQYAGTPSSTISFASDMVRNAFVQFSSGPLWANLLVLVVVAGFVATLWRVRSGGRVRLEAPLVGMITTALVAVLMISIGRSGIAFPDLAYADRYVYIVVALTLPAIAVAASGLAATWGPARWVVVACALALLPANIRALPAQGLDRTTLGQEPRFQEVGALAQSGDYDLRTTPLPFEADEVTVGWLDQTIDAGRFSLDGTSAEDVDPMLRSQVDLSTSFLLRDPGGTTRCRTERQGATVSVARGQRVEVDETGVSITLVVDDQPSTTVLLIARDRFSARLLRGPLDIQVTAPINPSTPVRICD